MADEANYGKAMKETNPNGRGMVEGVRIEIRVQAEVQDQEFGDQTV